MADHSVTSVGSQFLENQGRPKTLLPIRQAFDQPLLVPKICYAVFPHRTPSVRIRVIRRMSPRRVYKEMIEKGRGLDGPGALGKDAEALTAGLGNAAASLLSLGGRATF
jgi:hypothetical protein